MSEWHPEVIAAMSNTADWPEERIMAGALQQLMLGLPRIRAAAVSAPLFQGMTRRLGARVDFDDEAEAAHIDIMTACGPVRAFCNVKLSEYDVSLDVDERWLLLTLELSKMSVAQLERRAEIEIKDAEQLMERAAATRAEIQRRSP